MAWVRLVLPATAPRVSDARLALLGGLFAAKRSGRCVPIAPSDAPPHPDAAPLFSWLGLRWEGEPRPPATARAEALLRRLLHDNLAYPCVCTGPSCRGDCASLSLPPGGAAGYRLRAAPAPLRVHWLGRGLVSLPGETLDGLLLADEQRRPSPALVEIATELQYGVTDTVLAQEDLRLLGLRALCYSLSGAEVPRVFIPPPFSLLSEDPLLSTLQREGYLGAAVVNALALLGWSPPEGAEALSWELLLLWFEPFAVQGTVRFDLGRLRALNQAHLRALSFAGLGEALRPFLEEAGLLTRAPSVERWARLVREDISTLAEVRALAYLVDPREAGPEAASEEARAVLRHPEAAALLDAALAYLKTGDEDFHNLRAAIEASTGAKRKRLFFPLRVALTGRLYGPPLPELIPLLGAEEAARRIAAWRRWLGPPVTAY